MTPEHYQPTFSAGQLILSRFRIIRLIGSGGMGEVYEATDLELGRVALKTIRPEIADAPRIFSRFKKEVQLARKIASPSVCRIHELYLLPDSSGSFPHGFIDPRAFISMEFLDGVTLSNRIRESAPLPWPEAKRIALEICEGLQAIHDGGIVHRDLKSGNVMLASRNGIIRAVVTDFGLAREVSSPTADTLTDVTAAGGPAGTPAYMAPEQFTGDALTPATDIYALGVILYELVCSRHPFPSSTPVGTAVQRGRRILPPSSIQPELPHACDDIRKCLEFDPKLRYQSANEVAAALQSRSAFRRATAKPVLIGSAILLVLLALAAAWVHFHPNRKVLTEKDTVVLADFTNSTSDSVFDETLRQGLAVQLEQSPYLSLIPEDRIQQTLRLMNQAVDAKLTPAVAREICERTGSAAVIDGSIASLGSQYVLGLRATDCRTGRVFDEQQVQAARKEDVLRALSQMASDFRSRAGESLSTVKEHDKPLEEATTPSLEALKAYSTGFKVQRSAGSAAAIPFFKRAIEIDPGFAMAYANLGRMYGDIGEFELLAKYTSKAYELRGRASDREKLFITAAYDMGVTGNLEKADQICEAWKQTYPRDPAPHSLRGGIIYPPLARYEAAVEESRRTIELDPDLPIGYVILGYNLNYLNQFDEAGKTLDLASRRGLGNTRLHCPSIRSCIFAVE